MEKIERICPNCGTGNPYGRAQCLKCGTNLTSLPAPRQPSLPERIEGASAAALAVAASAFIARAGLRLIVRGILPHVVKSLAIKPASPSISDQSPEGQSGYVIRGWRVWSMRHGSQNSNGSEHFEWRINRNDGQKTDRTD